MTTNLRDCSITRPGTGAVTRTIADRLKDQFSVKDYGAKTDGTNASPGIQAAITDAIANGGGTVYFPAGTYNIGGRIVIPGSSNAALTLLGDCGRSDTDTGSILSGTLSDYLMYIGHSSTNAPKMPVKLIRGLCFKNSQAGSVPTSTEPPSSPDGTSGDGYGCLYIGSACTGMVVDACDFSVTKGTGIFSAANFLCLSSTALNGGFDNTYSSAGNIGIMARSVRIDNSSNRSLGTAFELVRGISQIQNVNVENCGVSARVGQNRLAYWEPDAAAGAGAIIAALSTATDPLSPTSETWSHVPAGMATIQFESPWIAGASLIDADNFILSITCENFAHAPTYGIYTEKIRRCKIGGTITGSYSSFAVALAQNSAKGGGNRIESVSASNSSGPVWSLPSASHYNSGDDPYVFVNCSGQDGGVTRANLPFLPSAGGSTVCVVITDSDVPTFAGSASNVGKPITGTGPYRVLARWNSTTSQWCVAG